MGLTKSQLEQLNNNSFPNNNSGYITPDILRQYNDAIIVNTVNQDVYLADSASFDYRLQNFNPANLVTTATFNAYTQSASASVGLLSASYVAFTASYYIDSASFNNRINTFNPTNLVNTASFNAYTQSVNTQLANLEALTGSYLTTGSLTSNQYVSGNLSFTQVNTFVTQSTAVTVNSQNGGTLVFKAPLSTNYPSLYDIYNFGSTVYTTLRVNGPGLSSPLITNMSASGADMYVTVALGNGVSGSSYTITGPLPQDVNFKVNNLIVSGNIATNQSVVTNTIGAQSGNTVSVSAATASVNGLVANNISSSLVKAGNVNSVSASFNYLTVDSASITYLKVIYETSSVVFSSGSNILGDNANDDVQTLIGRTKVTGSLEVTGSTKINGNTTITGSTTVAGNLVVTNNNGGEGIINIDNTNNNLQIQTANNWIDFQQVGFTPGGNNSLGFNVNGIAPSINFQNGTDVTGSAIGAQYPQLTFYTNDATYAPLGGQFGGYQVQDLKLGPTNPITMVGFAGNSYTPEFFNEYVGWFGGGGNNTNGSNTAIIMRTGSADMLVYKPTTFNFPLTVNSTTNFSELTGSLSAFSSSLTNRINTNTNNIVTLTSKTGSYATTGSNSFNGNQTITGSVIVTQGITLNGGYTGTYTDGIAIDYQTGNARFLAGTGDGFTFYNNFNVASASLVNISSIGGVSASSFTGSISSSKLIVSGTTSFTELTGSLASYSASVSSYIGTVSSSAFAVSGAFAITSASLNVVSSSLNTVSSSAFAVSGAYAATSASLNTVSSSLNTVSASANTVSASYNSMSASAVSNVTDTYTSVGIVKYIVSLTQAEYAAIGTPNANTLYIVI